MLAGWGRDSDGDIPIELMYGVMRVIDQYWCGYFLNKRQDYNETYARKEDAVRYVRNNRPFSIWADEKGVERDPTFFRNRHICVGYTDVSEDRRTSSSTGDSGGGLFLNNDVTRTVYGVCSMGSSYRSRDGFVDGPVIYTRVRFFVEWIRGKKVEFNRS